MYSGIFLKNDVIEWKKCVFSVKQNILVEMRQGGQALQSVINEENLMVF